jgi:hypothetical protein
VKRNVAPAKKRTSSPIRATRRKQAALSASLSHAIRITKELFSGEVNVEWDCDPESPRELFVVFNVRASGETSELLNRQRQWHRRVAAIMPQGESFRILIDPRLAGARH